MKDIRLSTGSLIRHTRAANGSTDAARTDGEPMTEAEWMEYCERRKQQAARDRKNAARRARHQAYIDLGMVRVRGAQGGIYYE